jgi:hypothetical protein
MNRTAAVLLWAAFVMGCSAKSARFIAYSNAPARFTAEIPSGWTPMENPAGGAPGVQFLLPPREGKLSARPYISVDFHPTGDPRCASIDACLAERTRQLPGRRYGPVTDVRVGPWAGKQFSLIKPLPQSPEFAPQGELSVRTLLLPAADGITEVCFAVPQPEASEQAAVFERFLKTFRRR